MATPRRRAWSWAAAATAVATGAGLYTTRRYFETAPGPAAFMHEDLRTAWTPAWRETLAGVQWLRLRRSESLGLTSAETENTDSKRLWPLEA